MRKTNRITTQLRRRFRGLWLSRDFRRLWASLTITSFGAQITNLALPLTAALLLRASPMQMGILIALETLPFALFSLHAGVLLDRVRKLPRSEEHTSELQSQSNLVCRLLLEKKKKR